MKKFVIIFLTILCMVLPVLGSQNKELFTACVLLWPIVIVGLAILKIKGFSHSKINEKNYKINEKKKKSDTTDVIKD